VLSSAPRESAFALWSLPVGCSAVRSNRGAYDVFLSANQQYVTELALAGISPRIPFEFTPWPDRLWSKEGRVQS